MQTLTQYLLLFSVLTIPFSGCNKRLCDGSSENTEAIAVGISSDNKIPFSDRKTTAKRELHNAIDMFSLNRIADDLEKLMSVSIRIKTSPDSTGESKTGISRMGGTPDLPNNLSWPVSNGVPMAFLAQFRLFDIAAFDSESPLPKSGMLYFFYEAQEQAWGFDPKDRDKWKVLYYDGEMGKLKTNPKPKNLPAECFFKPQNLDFSNEITFPSWEAKEIENLKLTEEESKSYIKLLDAIHQQDEVIHRLLGHPDQIQGNMQLECQLTSNGINTGDETGFINPKRAELEKGISDWTLLFQIDSDEKTLGTMWGDAGRVYFWIRKQDLKKQDFSKVWLILQCY